MKIFHFILGKADKNRANGVNQVVAGLAKYSIKAGSEVRVIGKANSVSYEGEIIEGDGFEVVVYSKWSKALRKSVGEAISWADVVHLHGTYAPHNIWAGWICDAYNTPYILTPHSGLSPQRKALKGRIRKTLFHLLFQRRHLRKATLLHALTHEESSEILTLIEPRNLVVIPNGIDLDDYPPSNVRLQHNIHKPIRIGYIGRLSKEKNIAALCKAFKSINKELGHFELLLAGPLPSNRCITQACMEKDIKLVGPKFGQEKHDFLEEIDLMILPSLSEGFPVSAAEALAMGLPLVVTRTSNLTYFSNKNAFVLCEPSSFGLEEGLRTSLHRRTDWNEMTSRGRDLIEHELNWAAITAKLMKAYYNVTNQTNDH